MLFQRTVQVSGLDRALSTGLARWRHGRTRHDPGKVLLDVAMAVALGGDCAADAAVVRAQPAVFGPVDSDATVSRLVTASAAEVDVALPAIRAARARSPRIGIAGMRAAARRERPHPRRPTTPDRCRRVGLTCFPTNTRGPGGTLAALEIRHRLRARAEDRIRGLKTWNDNPWPHFWTQTADRILESITRSCTRINDSRHWDVALLDRAVRRAGVRS